MQIFYNEELIASLRQKANKLPLSPGIYQMKDKNGKVIYVGKSKALKNRVTSYFTDLDSHTVKTARLVSNIHDFEVMLTTTEIEALALENRLIKLYNPKFNIKLKDGKSYPYIKVTMNEDYPRIIVDRTRKNDGARYFGPYSGISAAYDIVNTVRKTFGIPDCRRSFPKDIGKERPCLNHQIGLCCGVCTGKLSADDYKKIFSDVIPFLNGNFGDVKNSLTEQMEYAAENLMFEAAALCRDRIRSIEKLWDKQKVVAAPNVNQDIFGLYTDDTCASLAVFYVRNGAVIDKESFIFGNETIIDSEALISFLFELYRVREYVPREILLDFAIDSDELEALSSLLSEKSGHRVYIKHPEKGNSKQLCTMVSENAKEYAGQHKARLEKESDTLFRLAKLLSLEVLPEKIEAFDISNFGNDNITAGKVRIENGKFNKSAYRTYKIDGTQDDYASMTEAMRRRLKHTEDEYPDLFLLDGGKTHVAVIKRLFEEMGIHVPVFGMVKDEYHKTRALTTDTEEISIARDQQVFLLIYKLQEEVHRFTVSKMTKAKRKTLKRSSLEDIKGIGPSKAKALLAEFGGLKGVKEASKESLVTVKGISDKDADNIIEHFAKRK